MVENLRLNGNNVPLLTSADSDVTSNFALAAINNSASNWCNIFSAACINSSKVAWESTRYFAYYNWYTATAGTGTYSLTSGSAPSSICPKNWKLPTSGTNTSEIYNLYAQYSTGQALSSEPFNALFGGSKTPGVDTFEGMGSGGTYWSSNASSANGAYYLLFWANGSVSPFAGNDVKIYGFNVRCIAR